MEHTIENLVLLSQADPSYTMELWLRFEPLCIKWANKLKEIDYSQEDLQQESYLILLKALASYKQTPDKKFEAYYKYMLYRWGRNYKRKRREILTFTDGEHDYFDSVADTTDNIESQILYKEKVKYLQGALQTLNDSEYSLLVRLYVNQEKLMTISEESHVLYSTLESRKRYALKKLKDIFTFY